jgi:hypothetical protein
VQPEREAVCALKVPTAGELWTAALAAPGEAWSAAREHVPTLEDLRSMEWPKVDLGRQLERLRGLTGGVGDRTKEVGSDVLDGTKRVGRVAGDTIFDGLLKLTPDDWFTVYGSDATDAEALEHDPRR